MPPTIETAIARFEIPHRSAADQENFYANPRRCHCDSYVAAELSATEARQDLLNGSGVTVDLSVLLIRLPRESLKGEGDL